MEEYIRYANKDDADTLALINSKSAQVGFSGIIPDDFLKEKFSYERLKERFSKELDDGITSSSIIYQDNSPLGMMTFGKDDYKQRDNLEIDLWRLYVLPEYWGKSIAIKLIDWGIKELKRNGYTKLSLWVVEENIRARKFYEKVGFIHSEETRIINPGRELMDCRYVKQLKE